MSVVLFVLGAMMSLAPGRDHAATGTAIARAVLANPPLFANDESRLRTAAFVVAVAFRESSFRNGVTSATGDSCLLQVHGRPDLADDLDACLATALPMLRASMSACGGSNPLGIYATGTCASTHGQRISRDRMALARSLTQ